MKRSKFTIFFGIITMAVVFLMTFTAGAELMSKHYNAMVLDLLLAAFWAGLGFMMLSEYVQDRERAHAQAMVNEVLDMFLRMFKDKPTAKKPVAKPVKKS